MRKSTEIPIMKPLVSNKALLQDLREMIACARQDVARSVNSALVMLYWKIGQRIRKEILKEKRAEYGQEILSTLSRKLVEEFGDGFSQANLFRMVRFAEVFSDEKTIATLSRQLSWRLIKDKWNSISAGLNDMSNNRARNRR